MKRFFCLQWNTAPSRILSGGRWCCTAICFEGRILGVLLNLLFIFLNHFRPTSFCRIWITEEGMCSKDNMGHGRLPSVEREQWGLGLCCNLLPYRANIPSLKTLHSNHRITTHGTEMLFHTEKKIKRKEISEPLSTKAKPRIACSSLLCSLSGCESNCVRTCVCVWKDCPLTS